MSVFHFNGLLYPFSLYSLAAGLVLHGELRRCRKDGGIGWNGRIWERMCSS
jgi:hypothetical protein